MLCDFFLGDRKKDLFILGGGGALTDQGKNSIQVQLGEPLSLLGLLIGEWVTQRQLHHQEVSWAIYGQLYKLRVSSAAWTTH